MTPQEPFFSRLVPKPRVKVFLIGGLGFIGKRFIRKFSETHEIIAFAPSQDIENAKKTIDLSKVSIEEGFVEDQNLGKIIEKHQPDVIIHLAALTGLVKCHKRPDEAFKINVFGAYNVVNSCILSKAKLIFLSSREVYGETINQSSKEDDPLLPNNVYGITKMIGENLVKFAGKKHDLDYTILRLTNVYGPEGDQYGAEVIINKALKEKKIPLMGGSQRLNYVYVDDVVDVLNLVLDHPKSSKQIFNVGSKTTVSIEEFANKVSQIIGPDVKIEKMPMRETETSNFEPDLTKTEKELGFSAKTSLEQGIQKTIKWYSK